MKYAAAAIALATACPLSADAQQSPYAAHMQLDCLMRAAPEEARISAVHAYLESSGATQPDTSPAIALALDSCGKTHSWSSDQRSLAYDIMLYQTRTRELVNRFLDLKVEIRIVGRVGDQLMYVEKKPLLDRNWRKDAALEAHVRSLFAAQGITDEEIQRLGGDLVHALHKQNDLDARWEAKWPTPPLPPLAPPAPPRPRATAPPG